MDNYDNTLDLKIQHVDEKLESFKTDFLEEVREIKGDVKKLLTPKWTVWLLAAGLFSGMTGTMWKFAVQPIEDKVVQLTDELKTEIVARKTELVPKDVLEERRVNIASEFSNIHAEIKTLDGNKASNSDLAKAYIDFNIKRGGR